MGVMMQAFYWDCPAHENKPHAWWAHLAEKVPELTQAGFTALWLPPVSKGFNATGMGYDPYDYYDLGNFDQKGATATWFGSKDELIALIQACHQHGLQAYADLVLNHNSGADAQEQNPISGRTGWTAFSPESGEFPRDWNCFHPSDYESSDDGTFGEMPDLCHRNPKVYAEMMDYVKWLVENIGFDGFRYDMVKGYGGWLVNAIQEYRYHRNGSDYKKPFGVVEYWSGYDELMRYLNGVNFDSQNMVSAFDFPLRYRLRDLCDSYGFNLKELASGETILAARPSWSVTFVENHDTRNDPIVNEKMLAYAYILTHEGYPCVFWQDYYSFGLAEPGEHSGIHALVAAHERYAHGQTDILYVDDSLYIMQRRGSDGDGGLIFVLNNNGVEWRGNPVQTAFPNAHFQPVAFRGSSDTGVPDDEATNHDGWGDFWAPPRGYTVYARTP